MKAQFREIHCLHLANLNAFEIVETDTSKLGYCGILKQKEYDKECIVQYVSRH